MKNIRDNFLVNFFKKSSQLKLLSELLRERCQKMEFFLVHYDQYFLYLDWI